MNLTNSNEIRAGLLAMGGLSTGASDVSCLAFAKPEENVTLLCSQAAGTGEYRPFASSPVSNQRRPAQRRLR